MILIDGVMERDDALDPAVHVFIGMFRKPFNASGDGYIVCGCGDILQSVQVSHQHWSAGHWDILQYKTMEDAE